MAKAKLSDPSGRGAVAGYKVIFPSRQHTYTEEEIQAVVSVMRHSETQTQGPFLEQFEADFKAFTGANYAFGVNNCTNALRLAGILSRVGPGDEVIIPAYTYCATAIPFADLGARIVWADNDPKTWVVDPQDIERKITKKTKAIVAVHLLGMPCDMMRILAIARRHNIRVIEDCAQALDCRIHGQHVGTFGDFGCFSFHAAKTMTTLGEGGMLTVRAEQDAVLVPGIRHNGLCAYQGPRGARFWLPAMSCVEQDMPGVWPKNYCIGEAQCALGSVQLKSVIANNEVLIEQDRKIKERLSDVPEIEFAQVPEGGRYAVHQYIMHYNPMGSGKTRDDLLDLMTLKYLIRCIVQYYPLYRYPLFQKTGMGDADCPVVESWWDNSFSFPWWLGIPDETIAYMADSLKAAVEELRG